MPDAIDCPPRPAKPALILTLLILSAVVFVGLLALGIWQVQRLHWKQALIARMELRLHAAPVAAPGPAEWSAINRVSNEYSRIYVSGSFDHTRETLVRASTELGSGFWVVTPMQTADGFWVLVNRGFIPASLRAQASRPDLGDKQVVNGLLRLSEPGGSWLQSNNPGAGRWYSRDVRAIAANVTLDTQTGETRVTRVAPYFIDAGASRDQSAWPRGGLTVLTFNNNHLVYALTWFVLAAMAATAGAYLVYFEWQLRLALINIKPATFNA